MAKHDGSFPTALDHPTAGRSALDASRVAVRWRPGSTDEEREALLAEAGLTPAVLESERPGLAVNRTNGLWWAQGAGDDAVPGDALARLEQSELVEWVSPGYRSDAGRADDEGLVYAVNPTRVYVPEPAFEAAALPEGMAVDSARSSRLPGLAALALEAPSAAEGRTAVHVAADIPGARFESIPYLSPTCCAPPQGEFNPNDPLFATQWGLQRIEAGRAWQITQGDPSITVAVIDEGVQLDHPDLDLHPQSWNASTDTPDGSPTGDHGTACAGIAAARLDNAQGVAGVAGGARVMAIATATWADVDIAEGLYFAADNGARVVSMSFGVYPEWNFWDFDLVRDALQYAHDKGLVLIAASGNEDIPVSRFPGSDIRTLTVGGSNRSDERKRVGDASSENWWGACYGPDVDVVAPCLEMPTTDRLGAFGYDPGDYYDRFNGTSSATPCVAGLAALILSENPGLSNVEVRSIIESTCDKISPGLYAYGNVATKPSGTWNDEVGYGRVNAERALLAACGDKKDEGCRGCGGECHEGTPEECRAPAPLPWLDPHRCMRFYEGRIFDLADDRRRLQVRVTYEHCLRLLGRHQGGLLYTTTLLPGEEVQLYEFDRYRRVRSETERLSVHSSFRQTLSALSQTRRHSSASTYFDTLTSVRASGDVSVSAGGGLAGFFGAPSVEGEFSTEAETTIASGASITTVSDQFAQNAVTASQATDAERSIVISRFEEAEHVGTTSRKFRNHNECYAVTYYVRRVDEVYETWTRVESVEWRVGDLPWRDAGDLEGLDDELLHRLKEAAERLPRPGELIQNRREITLPTDGTLYEAELAHCSSCEPMHEEAMRIRLERERVHARRECLETELLALELERRRAAADVPLDVGPWPLRLLPAAASADDEA
ncbi:MAG TPA: S8 family serine peptidase [Solirubrobacteraceae bacterium]|nr:S8 family serine peptidase [Solirubrobacteraceae bacterium]